MGVVESECVEEGGEFFLIDGSGVVYVEDFEGLFEDFDLIWGEWFIFGFVFLFFSGFGYGVFAFDFVAGCEAHDFAGELIES